MMPYELIVTSASRPALLYHTLTSLLAKVDQPPTRILLHDDCRGDACAWLQTQERLQAVNALYPDVPMLVHHAHPARRLGLALNWLLHQVTTPYVLYTQDDFVTVRPLPVALALDTMAIHALHQIRFNKRATMGFKETWRGTWQKEEKAFVLVGEDPPTGPGCQQVTLTLADHWYFQTGLWRVAQIREAVAFWMHPDRQRRFELDEVEGLLNHYFDHVKYGGDPASHYVRHTLHRTYIWGPIGEDRYIRHIGGNPEDWAGDHLRTGAVDDQAKAWREIRTYGAE